MRRLAIAAIGVLGLSTAVLAYQLDAYRSFRGPYYGGEGTAADAKHEVAWSRLRYTSALCDYSCFGGFGFGFGGRRGGAWSTDYPKADIIFLAALRRLTRIDARSYQQVVDLDHEDIFDYPFVYAVQVEAWTFSEEEAKGLRE